MAFWDRVNEVTKNVTKELKSATKNLGDAANDTIETTRLNAKIGPEKKALEAEMKKIGEYYYQKYQEGAEPEEAIAEFCKAADAHKAKIEELERQIAEVEAAKVKREEARAQAAAERAAERAAREEAVVDGTAVEVPESTCSTCGAKIEFGANFCPQCGAQQQTVAPEPEEAAEEETPEEPSAGEEPAEEEPAAEESCGEEETAEESEESAEPGETQAETRTEE